MKKILLLTLLLSTNVYANDCHIGIYQYKPKFFDGLKDFQKFWGIESVQVSYVKLEDKEVPECYALTGQTLENYKQQNQIGEKGYLYWAQMVAGEYLNKIDHSSPAFSQDNLNKDLRSANEGEYTHESGEDEARMTYWSYWDVESYPRGQKACSVEIFYNEKKIETYATVEQTEENCILHSKSYVNTIFLPNLNQKLLSEGLAFDEKNLKVEVTFEGGSWFDDDTSLDYSDLN